MAYKHEASKVRFQDYREVTPGGVFSRPWTYLPARCQGRCRYGTSNRVTEQTSRRKIMRVSDTPKI